MKDNWSDEKFATEWDNDSAVSNPTRSMLLDLLSSIVVDNYKEGNKILDLGFGTGHVEALLLSKIPNAHIVGVDASDVMIAKAKDRLKSYPNVTTINQDLNNIKDLVLPTGSYQIALTSFVLHEIPAKKKQEIFKFIYDTLVPGGMYILLDRFKIDSDGLNLPYSSQWNWQSKVTNWADWKDPFDKYKVSMKVKEDSPDTLEDQLAWLRQVGFKAACLQLQLDRGLIVGIK